jgi:peptide/nickel transport system ATP-binding protein
MTDNSSLNLSSAEVFKIGYPLSVRGLSVDYKLLKGNVKAVRGVSFDLQKGENLSLIGESGCGKTTLGLALIRLLVKTAVIGQGEIIYQRDGKVVNVLALNETEMRHFRWSECAMVFQSALNAFNPVLTIWDQFQDTYRAHGSFSRSQARKRTMDLLAAVQLDPKRVIDAYPHTLSGGMRQRVLLAMSLALNPQVIILDEPTTALDILTQRTIIDLLRRLKADLGFSTIFISHDLTIAAELADRVAAMYAGTIVELGSVNDIFFHPAHPYTAGLIHAVPTVTGKFQDLISIPGAPPDLMTLPSGCKFHPRCPYATDVCHKEEPPLAVVGPGHLAACFHSDKLV